MFSAGCEESPPSVSQLDAELTSSLFPGMEDAHTALLKLDGHTGNAFFAVYDGHGGGSRVS
jgi:serine/threonine protein phosphatase PrpC